MCHAKQLCARGNSLHKPGPAVVVEVPETGDLIVVPATIGTLAAA